MSGKSASFWDTPAKDIPRRVVMSRRPLSEGACNRRWVARTALTLPGDKMLCVKAGIEAKIFNKRTLHVFVERDAAAQRRIARQINRLDCTWAPRFHRDDLTNLPLRAALDNRPLDFAYLDLCAALNSQVARWIYLELAPSLAPGATVAFTLSRNWRTSKFMKWATQAFRTNLRHVWQSALSYIYAANYAGMVGDMSDYYDDGNTWCDGGYMLPSRDRDGWNRLLRPEYHDASVDILAALFLLFPRHEFDVEACVEYRRSANHGHWMTTFVLTNFVRLEDAWLSPHTLRAIGNHMVPKLGPL